jgi:hypothetical protein
MDGPNVYMADAKVRVFGLSLAHHGTWVYKYFAAEDVELSVFPVDRPDFPQRRSKSIA